MNKQLTIADIVTKRGLQTRAGALSKEHVEDLKAAYEAKEELPLLRVWEIKGKAGYHLTRGFHRLAALKALGRVRVDCEVKAGTWAEAVQDAILGNLGHGLHRSRKDKRRCVQLLIDEFPDWTDRKIAEAAGVSHTLVADVKGPEEKEGKPAPTTIEKMQKTLAKMANEKLDPITIEQWLKDICQSAQLLADEIKKQGGLF